jgi:hypothetical protein
MAHKETTVGHIESGKLRISSYQRAVSARFCFAQFWGCKVAKIWYNLRALITIVYWTSRLIK